MADKCRWCAGTGLYYPLVGAPESCRECQNPVTVKMAREYDLRDTYYIAPKIDTKITKLAK